MTIVVNALYNNNNNNNIYKIYLTFVSFSCIQYFSFLKLFLDNAAYLFRFYRPPCLPCITFTVLSLLIVVAKVYLTYVHY